MSDTPVFDEVWKSNPFTVLPTEYTDRYTPEVARQEGDRAATQRILERLQAIDKPSKQLKELIKELEEQE